MRIKFVDVLVERERERFSVLICFSPFYIGDGRIASSMAATTPQYYATRLY